MKLGRFFLFSLLMVFSLSAITQEQASILSLLRKREPNHRAVTKETFVDQTPKVVVFYAPNAEGKEIPVKMIEFYEDRSIKYEMDVCEVEKESEGEKLWKSTLVGNGVRADFYPKGNVKKTAFYKKGLLHGPVQVFHPNGNLRSSLTYKDNNAVGPYVVYTDSGEKKEEGEFVQGKIHGTYTYYYPEGTVAVKIPYQMGVVNGVIEEWHKNGAIKAKRHMQNGKPQGNGKVPALQLFNEEHNLVESLDFQEGQPVGPHQKFYPSGQESFKVVFKEGKKEGLEKVFVDYCAFLPPSIVIRVVNRVDYAVT